MDNAAELLAQPDIDGGLIGGASLILRSFTQSYLPPTSENEVFDENSNNPDY